MSTPVRRCPRCGEHAAVTVREWPGSSSIMGLSSVRSGEVRARDFACQACGHLFRPREGIRAWLMPFIAFIFGTPIVLMGAALFFEGALQFDLGEVVGSMLCLGPGLAMSAWAFWQIVRQWTFPVIDGAPLPPMRFRLTEPLRRCSCGQSVACSKVTENTTNGIPTGIDYDYVCGNCGHSWTIESPLGMSIGGAGGLLIGGAGLAALVHDLNRGEGPACAGALILFGALLMSAAMYRLLARRFYPIIKPEAEQP